MFSKAAEHPWLLDMPVGTLAGVTEKEKPRSDGLSTSLTLTKFHEVHYLPFVSVAGGRNEKTIRERKISLRYWAEITGNPPMREITNQTAALFVSQMRLKKYRGKLISDVTIKKHCLALAAILNIAGPWSVRNKFAMGLLEKIPAFPITANDPDVTWKTPTVTHLAKILKATHVATFPKLPEVDPWEWWTAIYLVLYNTGVRKGDILNARWRDIQRRYDHHVIIISSKTEKKHIEKVIPLNPACIDALNLMPHVADDDLIFPFPHSDTTFTRTRKAIITAADLPCPEMGGFHAIRRLVGSIVENAAKVLGHTNPETTRNHYQSIQTVAGALDKLPQPEF